MSISVDLNAATVGLLLPILSTVSRSELSSSAVGAEEQRLVQELVSACFVGGSSHSQSMRLPCARDMVRRNLRRFGAEMRNDVVRDGRKLDITVRLEWGHHGLDFIRSQVRALQQHLNEIDPVGINHRLAANQRRARIVDSSAVESMAARTGAM